MRQLIIALAFLVTPLAHADNDSLPGVSTFIDKMVAKHHFDADKLQQTFDQVEVKDSILKAIARPAEKSKPWYQYRKIFITDARINGGVAFWQAHKEALDRAERTYGVPAEIIVAILGVETLYGGNVGGYRVIDSLSTLAFRYPPRQTFFRSELEQFLLLAREENEAMLEPIGSYAGAMGLGQFMPSSYRAYAVDFDHDGKRDIWTNPNDAIGSIANYLQRHGWVAGQSIVHQTELSGAVPLKLIELGVKPSISREQLQQAGVSLSHLPAGTDNLALIALMQPEGDQYWLARKNFYVITRYNHSSMYAMAVSQLGQAIHERVTQ